ncbi:hypothetical protein HZC53_01090 [Candidatus Uhrbacteria bacterium]|nr:hypothetical protein [Candidatus Uhrbacteria bacterium]
MPAAEAQAAVVPHDMLEFSVPQHQGAAMPCCWSAPDSRHADDRAPVEIVTGPAVGNGFLEPAFSVLAADSLTLTQDVYAPSRTKFETRSSNKRE